MEEQFNSWNNIYGNGDDGKKTEENTVDTGSENKVEQTDAPQTNPYGTIYQKSYNMNADNMNANNMNSNNINQSNINQNHMNQGYMPHNGMPHNGIPQDGMPHNGMPHNGMPQNTKNKKKGSFGVTLAKTAAIALTFGLVSGTVFTGINAAGNLLFDNNSVESDSRNSTSKKEETNKEVEYNPTDGQLSQTVSGNATDLTDVSAIVNEVMPSVVAITNTAKVTYRSFWGQTYSEDAQSCGSGFIIDQTEDYIYIATNNHVVADAESLTVQFVDEQVVEAEIRGTDPADDLAVVQVKVKDIPEDTLSAIKVATIANEDEISVGSAAIAIGNALGYGQSVTTGVISALGRSVTTSDSSSGQTVTNSNLIQTDAAINPGNSGGALLNSNGKVIGINSVKYASTEVEGIGYAIPITDALPILETIINDGEYTNTQSAYLGIQGLDVSSEMAAYNIPTGVYVTSVYDGSGAANAGIQEGDIITKIDKTPISTMSELQSYLSKCSAGDTIKVTIQRQQGRGYQEAEVEVTLSSADELK